MPRHHVAALAIGSRKSLVQIQPELIVTQEFIGRLPGANWVALQLR